MPGDVAYTIPSLVTQGPQYADLVNTALAAIQTHNHDGVGAGALIDLSAQQCTTDLSIDSHNLTDVRSIDFVNNPSTLTGPQDVLCIYVDQGNLYYNTSDGTPVQLTNGNVPAVPALAFENFIPRSAPVTANATILYTDTYNLINLNSGGGSFTIGLPIANIIQPIAVGRLYVFRDVTNSCGTHPVTISVATGSGNTFGDTGSSTFTLSSSGAYVALFTDGVSKWWTWTQNNFNGETVRLDNTSTLQVNNSSVALTGGGLTLDSASELTSTGATIIVAGGDVLVSAAAELAFISSAAVIFETTTSGTFESGSTLHAESGSTLQLDSGSTCNSAGTLNVTGTTAISGTTTISGTGTTLSGTMNLTGTIASSGSITGTKASQYTSSGSTLVSGLLCATTMVSAGTYTCDSGGALDYYIGILDAPTGTWVIEMPPSPANGRRIAIQAANFTDPTTWTTTNITIDGNGHPLAEAPWAYLAPSNVPFGAGFLVEFMYISSINIWVVLNSQFA